MVRGQGDGGCDGANSIIDLYIILIPVVYSGIFNAQTSAEMIQENRKIKGSIFSPQLA